jgi:hypothetical protein
MAHYARLESTKGCLVTSYDSKTVVQEFCQECHKVHTYWQMCKYLFDENPDVEMLKAPHYEHFFAVIKMSLYESFVQSVVRLHDPAIQLGQPNLTVNYICDDFAWQTSTKTKLDMLRDQMASFVANLKPARNKFTAHNDLKTVMDQPLLAAFDKPLDENYFDTLEEFASVALGERFIFGKFVPNDVELFMMAFGHGRIK